MSRAKPPTGPVPPLPPPAFNQLMDLGDLPEETEQLDTLLEELDASQPIQLSIYRRNPAGVGRDEWLTAMNPAECGGTAGLMASLQSQFGPGEYRLMFRTGDRLLRHRVAKIGGLPRPPPAAAPAPAADQLLLRVVETMNAGFAAMASKLDRPPADPSEALKQALGLLATAKEIIGPPAAAPGLADPVKLLRETLALSEEIRDLAPQQNGDSTLSDVLLELVRGIAKNGINFGALAQAITPPPAPDGIVTPPLPPPAVRQAMAAEAAQLAQGVTSADAQPPQPSSTLPPGIDLLIQAAILGEQPENMLDVFFAQLPEEDAETLALLQNEGLVQSLAQTYPDLAPLAPWFERLRLAAILELQAADTGE